MFATNPETAIEVEKLAKALNDLSIGDVLPYAALSKAIGYSVQDRPFTLMKARRSVEKDSGIRFETVNRVGVKKLPADSVPGIGASARKKMARTARRQAARLTGLRYNDIDAPTQQRIDAERSLLGAISVVAGSSREAVTAEAATGPIVANRMFEILRSAAA